MSKSAAPTPPNSDSAPNPGRASALEKLGDQITELSAHLDAGTYQLLMLIAKFDKHEGWAGTGINSCAHWLNWRCGMNLGAARERVRVARALPGLPQISAAFREGRISYSKARAMTRVATVKNESALLNVALSGTASHVEKQVRLYRKCKRLEALKNENLRHAHRELNWYQDDDGSWVFSGRFTPEQGALIRQAVDGAMEQLFREQKNVPPDVSAETSRHQFIEQPVAEPIAARRADALQRVAEGFLDKGQSQASSGDRFVVNIHTDADTLEVQGTGAESELEEGGRVSAETSRRLSCDCSVVRWLERNGGEPLSVGRKTRTIPPSIRRALQRRDGGCRFPGCTCTRFVDAHHVVHWADGGETSMDNLVLLCRRHHRLVHEEGFGVNNRGPGRFEFSLPSGKLIPDAVKPRFRGNAGTVTRRNSRLGLNITPKTPVPAWYGERMDPQMAVEALLFRE